MSTTLESPAVAEKLPGTSLLESIRDLSPEDKETIFLAILREALEINGDTGLLPIEDEEGRGFGYYVPPKAAEDRYKLYGPQLTEEEEAELERRIRNPGPTQTIQEVLADLNAQLAEIEKKKLESSVPSASETAPSHQSS